MTTEPALLVSLDLAGTFTFAVNGGLTAVRAARLDIVGVVTLAMVSGLGGGIIRDILLGAVPPATFMDWRYLAVGAAGCLAAFALSTQLAGLATLITSRQPIVSGAGTVPAGPGHGRARLPRYGCACRAWRTGGADGSGRC
jgi:uncharacterized membrane protein YeiH